jgi:general secretion pathway protein G
MKPDWKRYTMTWRLNATRRNLLLVAIFLFSVLFVIRRGAQVTPVAVAREGVLRNDLAELRKAIENYTLDKHQAPLSLQDLVDGKYLREIPTDPFTLRKDWSPYLGDAIVRSDQNSAGIIDVRSSSDKVGRNGVPYNKW